MNKTQFITGDFCFDINTETYLEKVTLKKEETLIEIRLEAPESLQVEEPENYKRAIFQINNKGEAVFLPTHQAYIKAYSDGELLGTNEMVKAIVEFINYTKSIEGSQEMINKRSIALEKITNELKQEYNNLLSNDKLIHCLKISEEKGFIISTEMLLQNGNICPKHKKGITTAIKKSGNEIPILEDLDFEKLESLLNKVFKINPQAFKVGQVISLSSKQCYFYLKMLGLGEDFLKETLEMQPISC